LIIIPKILIKNLDLNFEILFIWVFKFECLNLNTQIFKIRLFCSILALRREKMPHCMQVKFGATALQISNLHFQDAGLGDPNLQI